MHQVGHLIAGPDTPVLTRSPGRILELNGFADVSRCLGVGEGADANSGLGKRAQEFFEPLRTFVPPVPEQFGVESCDHQGVAADAGGFTAQTRPNGFDEVGDMLVDGGRSEFGVVRQLVGGVDGPSGDPRRLETRLVVVGVEVAVGGVTRISGLGGPDPVADLQVAAECNHVGFSNRAAEGRVAAQGGAVDHEVGDARFGVPALHARGVPALGSPDPGRSVIPPGMRVGETFAEGERPQARIEQRLERVGQRPAEKLEGLAIDEVAEHR